MRKAGARREGEQVDAHRHGERRPTVPAVERDDRRRIQQQDHVQGQDIEIAKLMRQQHDPDDGPGRIVEERAGIMPFQIKGIVARDRQRREQGERQNRDDDLRTVKLQRA